MSRRNLIIFGASLMRLAFEQNIQGMSVSNQKQILCIAGIKTTLNKAVEFLDVPGAILLIPHKNLGLETFPVVFHGLNQVDILPLSRRDEILAFVGYAAGIHPTPFICRRKIFE